MFSALTPAGVTFFVGFISLLFVSCAFVFVLSLSGVGADTQQPAVHQPPVETTAECQRKERIRNPNITVSELYALCKHTHR